MNQKCFFSPKFIWCEIDANLFVIVFLQCISLKPWFWILQRFCYWHFAVIFLGECWVQQSVPLGSHCDVRLQSWWRTNMAPVRRPLLPGERVWWPLHRGDYLLLRSSRIVADGRHPRHREAGYAVCLNLSSIIYLWKIFFKSKAWKWKWYLA